MTIGLELTRSQILAFRRRATALDERLPRGRRALRRAAWAGLQDSMPRAALLSIHARMAGTEPGSWEDPSLVQVWGPRFSTYVVAKRDLAVFTLGRLPDESGPQKRAQDIAARLRSALAGRRMTQGAAARAMGAKHANQLRYAAPTGTVLIRWDGSRQPDIWNVPAPEMRPARGAPRTCPAVFAGVRPHYARSLREVGGYWAAFRYRLHSKRSASR